MLATFRRTSILTALVLGLLSVTSGIAQEPTLRASISGIRDGDYPSARMFVNTDDFAATGDVALTADDVTVTVDGTVAPITDISLATSEDASLDVLLIIDTSTSWSGAPIAYAQTAAKELVRNLEPGDRVAVMSFNDSTRVDVDFTTDRAAAEAAIDNLVATGNTAFYQATFDGAHVIAGSSAARRAVVLLSDGAEFGNKSIASRDDAIAAARDSGVPFYVIGQGPEVDLPYMQALVGATSGLYLEAPAPQDLQSLFAGIGTLLRSQYVITFDASGIDADGAEVLLTLRRDTRVAEAQLAYVPGASFGPPAIIVDGLAPGDSVDLPRQITARAESGAPLGTVTFFVDDVNVFEASEPPYAYNYDPAAFAGGAHVLRVSVGNGARPSTASVDFSSVAPPSKGGGTPVVLYGAIAGVALLAVGAFLFLRSRRKPQATVAQRIGGWATPIMPRAATTEPVEEPPLQAESVGEPMGLLIARSGNDLGSEYVVGSEPVSIGSGRLCGVRINDPDLSGEEARIWVRDGHLMVHRITRLNTLHDSGVTGGWVILEPGDSFDIGDHRWEFRIFDQQPSRPGDVSPTAVPNILRAPAPVEPTRPSFASGGAASVEEGGDESRPSPPTKLSEMMPKSDVNFGRNDDARAS